MSDTEDIQDVVMHIIWTKYFSAAAIVALLYDHLHTLPDEVELIWKARWNVVKVLFLINRYSVPAVMIMMTWQVSGLSGVQLDDAFCKGWVLFEVWSGVISIGVSNFIVLLRLWVLWDRDALLVIWTLCIYFITQVAALVSVSIMSVDARKFLVWSPPLQTCILTHEVPLPSLWAPGLVFEVMVFFTTVINALYRPRDGRTALTTALYRDGFVYFITLTALRSANLALAADAPLSLVFLGVYIIWSMTTITMSRLVLNMRAITVRDHLEDESHLLPPAAESIMPLSPRRKQGLFAFFARRDDGDRYGNDGWQKKKEVNPGSVGSARSASSSTPWDAYEMSSTARASEGVYERERGRAAR